jgi:hypothetical protein
VQKGKTQQFTATVRVVADASKEVRWSVAGHNVEGATAISALGLLAVAADETATTLTVAATSTFDTTKVGTATVTVSSETGVENRLTAAVTLFPNPFADKLHIVGAEGCSLRIINSAGSTVYTRRLTSSSEAILTENLPAGLYFFHLEKGGKSKMLQAVKN